MSLEEFIGRAMWTMCLRPRFTKLKVMWVRFLKLKFIRLKAMWANCLKLRCIKVTWIMHLGELSIIRKVLDMLGRLNLILFNIVPISPLHKRSIYKKLLILWTELIILKSLKQILLISILIRLSIFMIKAKVELERDDK